ncbi:MAG: hypothetical protein EBR82_16065 [Caulobacteraceae bacterium]|nr:hypothetical protein [Caulobacteraceae bacterium]
MLPVMLMLLAAPLPQTAPQTASLPEPPAAPTVRIDAEGALRGVERSQEAVQRSCRNGALQRADNPSTVRASGPLQTDLMFRQGDPLQMTLLLERRIGQCSVPISYDVTTPGGRLPSFPARPD